MAYRILYFRGGLLERAEEIACDDLLAATKAASSTHPHLAAEIWCDGRKVVVVRPCSLHELKHQLPFARDAAEQR